ncbi:TPA: hypothetical protein ACIDIN_000691 [Shigella flexneri]|nr:MULTISPECIES: hypothetical protein [Enterobacteriaceae]
MERASKIPSSYLYDQ